MQRRTWERELRTKEQDISFTHRRISRLYANLNTHKNISRVTAKHKSLVAEANMTYEQYIHAFNQQKEKVRHDFCERIKKQIARLHVYEKLRTQLVNRMHQAGMRAEEFIRFEPVSRSNGAGTSYGGFVIYSKGGLTGKRPHLQYAYRLREQRLHHQNLAGCSERQSFSMKMDAFFCVNCCSHLLPCSEISSRRSQTLPLLTRSSRTHFVPPSDSFQARLGLPSSPHPAKSRFKSSREHTEMTEVCID